MTVRGKRHVLGYGWAEGRPLLKVAPGIPGNPPEMVAIGERLALRRLPGRECIGWRNPNDGGWRPCPMRADSSSQCLECSRREGWWACMTCDGFACPPLEPAMETICRRTTYLYLASFGTPELKVGTASGPRKRARVVEQGPLAAAHIAEAPGPIIKQMEALAVRLGFLERLRRSTKSRQFAMPVGADAARPWIDEGFAQLTSALTDYQRYFYPAPQWVTLPELARVPKTNPWAGVPVLTLNDGEGTSGRVVGARGHLVLLHDGAGHLALDLGALKAGFVELNPAEPPRGPARQLGLFG